MSESLLTESNKSLHYFSSDGLPLDLQPKPRKGLLHFLKCNVTVILAFVTGAACVGGVLQFTLWLSTQVLECPNWALGCEVPREVKLIKTNYGLVQGLVTTIYSIGLAALAFSAHAFSESALWPLLHKQSLSINRIDTYLEASRGSIPASPFILMAARNLDSIFVVFSTMLITLAPLAAAPAVGQVYNRRNMTVNFQSNATAGGGIGVLYQQTRPPGPTRESSGALYSSWQRGLSSEPMPEYRNWFIDRLAWSKRGNFTVDTVRMQQDITCRGWEAIPEKDGDMLKFKTKMDGDIPDRDVRKAAGFLNDADVYVRDVTQLATWVHSYKFESPKKTTATLIFSALNGTIDGGKTTKVPKGLRAPTVTSIACDITVEFFDQTLAVGDKQEKPVRINYINHINSLRSAAGKDAPATKNEILLWFAAAPVANGVNVYGAQPMYVFKDGWIPERFTSTDGGANTGWTVEYIENFIRVITGASLLGEVDKWPKEKITVTSQAYSVKMDPSRPLYLLVLPAGIIVLGLLLLGWNLQIHRRQDIPIMRMATLGEILKSSQTPDVLGAAALDKIDATESSRLNKLRVKFTRSEEGVWGLHDPSTNFFWEK